MNSEPVVRGMAVAAAPLRLRREPATVPTQSAPSIEDSFSRARDEGRSQGMAEGRAEGWSTGYEEGLQAGRSEAARETESRVAEAVRAATASLHARQERLSAVVAELADTHRQVASSAEDDLVALCFETLVRIVGRAAVTPEAVRDIVQRAIFAMHRQPRILLRVHPEDAALLDACAPSQEVHGPVLAWRADAEVESGGCIVEGAAGALDLRLDTMLADCRTALLHARERRRTFTQAENAR